MAKSNGAIRPEHNFLQPRQSWEEAVFDNAAYFATMDYAERPPVRHEWQGLNEALTFVNEHPRACLYAVTASGRFALLERSTLPEWRKRWMGRRRNKQEKRT